MKLHGVRNERWVTRLRLRRTSTCGPKCVQGPKVRAFIVAQDIEIAVVSLDTKIGGTCGIPAILNVLNFEEMAAQGEA